MLKTIFVPETREEAETQCKAVAGALHKQSGGLARMMAVSRRNVLACMDFPREHWAEIASTNPLE